MADVVTAVGWLLALIGGICALMYREDARRMESSRDFCYETANRLNGEVHEANNEIKSLTEQLQRANSRGNAMAKVIDNIEAAIEGVPVEEQK